MRLDFWSICEKECTVGVIIGTRYYTNNIPSLNVFYNQLILYTCPLYYRSANKSNYSAVYWHVKRWISKKQLEASTHILFFCNMFLADNNFKCVSFFEWRYRMSGLSSLKNGHLYYASCGHVCCCFFVIFPMIYIYSKATQTQTACWFIDTCR